MATNLAINDELLLHAQKIGNLKTKKDTVNLALEEFIERREQLKILDLFNTVEYSEGYDYKKARENK